MAEEENKKADSLDEVVGIGAAGLQAYLGLDLGLNYVAPYVTDSLSFLSYSTSSFLGYAAAIGLAVGAAYLGYEGGKWTYNKILKPVGGKILGVMYSLEKAICSLFGFWDNDKKEVAPDS